MFILMVVIIVLFIAFIINKNSYNKEGYDKGGYYKFDYNKSNYNMQGYDKDGYDKYGYNKSDYDKDGYNMKGFNKQGYGKDGYYNLQGYDKDGYNKFGYDKYGYDKSGYNKDGYNMKGFNKQGYGKDGYYNLQGYDKDGYNRDGYNKSGYNGSGYNKSGYDKYGYNKEGHNIYGRGQKDYNKKLFFKTLKKSNSEYEKVRILKYVLDDYSVGIINQEFIEEIIEKFDDKELIDILEHKYKILNKDLNNNKGFLLGVVKKRGFLLEYASVLLQDDKNLVLEAVKNNGHALEYVSERLRSDKETMLYILTSLVNNKKYNSIYYDYIGDTLKKDSGFIIQASKIIKENNKEISYIADFQFTDSSKIYKYIVDINFNNNYSINDIVIFKDHRGITKEIIVKSKKYSLDISALPYKLRKINIISKKEKDRDIFYFSNDEYNGNYTDEYDDYDDKHSGNYSNLSESATELGFINESDYEDWLDSKSD